MGWIVDNFGSSVVDPSGEILLDAGLEPGLYLQTIDLGQVKYWRDYERIYSHRRQDIYKM